MFCCLCLSSCENKDYYKIDMNTDYKDTSNLEDGNGNKTKVVLLLGQSNASGCSYNDYLQKNISEEEYQKFENGFENVLINYCIDNQAVSSDGDFKNVDLPQPDGPINAVISLAGSFRLISLSALKSP